MIFSFLFSAQVLYVPRHWWHYVESVDPVTVSVNSWIELVSLPHCTPALVPSRSHSQLATTSKATVRLNQRDAQGFPLAFLAPGSVK